MSDQAERDAAHDAATSSGTPTETAISGSGSDVGLESEADLVDGALSPGSTATGSPTARD